MNTDDFDVIEQNKNKQLTEEEQYQQDKAMYERMFKSAPPQIIKYTVGKVPKRYQNGNKKETSIEGQASGPYNVNYASNPRKENFDTTDESAKEKKEMNKKAKLIKLDTTKYLHATNSKLQTSSDNEVSLQFQQSSQDACDLTLGTGSVIGTVYYSIQDQDIITQGQDSGQSYQSFGIFQNQLNKGAFHSGEHSSPFVQRKICSGDLTPSPNRTSGENSSGVNQSNNMTINSQELALNESLPFTYQSSGDKVIFQNDGSPHPFLNNNAWKQKKNACKTLNIQIKNPQYQQLEVINETHEDLSLIYDKKIESSSHFQDTNDSINKKILPKFRHTGQISMESQIENDFLKIKKHSTESLEPISSHPEMTSVMNETSYQFTPNPISCPYNKSSSEEVTVSRSMGAISMKPSGVNGLKFSMGAIKIKKKQGSFKDFVFGFVETQNQNKIKNDPNLIQPDCDIGMTIPCLDDCEEPQEEFNCEI